jgi:hypothetical protein
MSSEEGATSMAQSWSSMAGMGWRKRPALGSFAQKVEFLVRKADE